LLDSAIAAAELLEKCPGCAAVLHRGGRPRALVDAALAEQAERVAEEDGDADQDADDGGADGTAMWPAFAVLRMVSRIVGLLCAAAC